jgi:adenine-specific DNA-methyltransferase
MPTLHWIGKDKVVKHHHEVPFKTLRREYVHTAPEGTPANSTGNRIIHGDNLEALKALLPEFEGRVKCIYIDPPYNTGNEGWVYNDNVNDPRIQKWLHQVVGKEGEDLSRHDKWLCMMYPRLKLLHRLLAANGLLFVNLDDTEASYCRCMLDEIFGRSNCLASVSWEKRYTRSNNAKMFYSLKDTILVYRRTDAVTFLREERTEKSDSLYKNPDNDPRGQWMTSSYVNPAIKEKRPNLVYEIENPFNGQLINHPTHAWKYEKNEHLRHVRENRLWWGNDKNAIYPRLKLFLNESDGGLVPVDVWKYQDSGTTDEGGNELKEIFGSALFDNPKPTRLIERVLKLATDSDSIILDSFAGSGTTAHAVLKLNAQDGGNRRFIMTEMMDYAETITAERVRRVMNGYGDPSPQPSPAGRGSKFVPGLGGSFEYYTIGEALFDEDGNLNEAVPVEEIRRYVAYTEGIECVGAKQDSPASPAFGLHGSTGEADETFASPLQDTHHPAYLGTSSDAAYFFYYEPDRATTLDHEYLSTLTFSDNRRPTTLVVYADNCLLSQDQLRKHGIIFKKIPRDITRF